MRKGSGGATTKSWWWWGLVVLGLTQTGAGLHVVGGGFLQLYSRMWCACSHDAGRRIPGRAAGAQRCGCAPRAYSMKVRCVLCVLCKSVHRSCA